MCITMSAREASDSSLSWSLRDAISAFTLNLLSSSFAFSGERTGVVMSKVSALGCCRRRLSTEPPIYPVSQVRN